MATYIAACGFECRTAGNTAAHYWNNQAAPVTDTTVFDPGGGDSSLKFTCAGALNSVGVGPLSRTAAAAVHVVRFKIRVDSMSAAGVVAQFTQGATATTTFMSWDPATSKLGVFPTGGYGTNRQNSQTLNTAQWYWVDVYLNGTNKTLDWYVDGNAQTQLSIGGSAGTYSSTPIFGCAVTEPSGSVPASGTFYIDHVGVSQTSGDFPLTHTAIVGFVPGSDGTHNTGAAGNFTNGTTNITNATTTAWTLLDERPASSTDKVVQALDTTGLLYVEVNLNSTTEQRTPLAVDCAGTWRAASAASAAGQVKLRDNLGATDSAIVNTTIAVTTDTWYTAMFAARPAALGAWTLSALNALRVRLGFGTDVTPDIWFGGITVEVALRDDRVPYTPPMPPLLAH